MASTPHPRCSPLGVPRGLLAAMLLSLAVSQATVPTTNNAKHLSPPEDVTVHCTGTGCCIWWGHPLLVGRIVFLNLTYQLDIQRQRGVEPGSRNPLVDINGTTEYQFLLPEPQSPHTVRIRAAFIWDKQWSAWSESVEFGLPALVHPLPSLNVTFNRKSMRLSWNCEENVTNVRCMRTNNGHPYLVTPQKMECWCSFKYTTLHKGVTFDFYANVNHSAVHEKLVYPNPGPEGTAARNLSCVVYDAAFMNCSWEKGPAAPDGTQYFFYIVEDTERETEMECPHYTPETGTHTGCHFDNMSGFRDRNYFVLNGTSPGNSIQFFDTILSVSDIEHMSIPGNVTVQCDVTYCTIRWEQPRTLARLSYMEIDYELHIQRNKTTGSLSTNFTVTVEGAVQNIYPFFLPEPEDTYTVRIRAANSWINRWSAWTQPVEFGGFSGEDQSSTLGLTFDPQTRRLSWTCRNNTKNVWCVVTTRDRSIVMTARDSDCSCTFSPTTLEGSLMFNVIAHINGTEVQAKLVYPNPDQEGTAAQNFSCVVYNGASMNCSWQKGPTAPEDVQYFLHVRDERTREKEMECPHYTPDSGTHTGCHFNHLKGFEAQKYFLLNGTSQRARIEAVDFVLNVKDIERVTAPRQVTVHCERSHCFIWWEQPYTVGRMSSSEVMYQLDIQKQQSSEPGKRNSVVSPNGKIPWMYILHSHQPLKPHTVRVRAASAQNGHWSAWSQPMEFGLPPHEEPTPKLNLRFDTDLMRLWWFCPKNVTNIRCLMTHQNVTVFRTPKNTECGCTFTSRTLHQGVTLEVHANLNHRAIQEKIVYRNPGEEGTAAQNFSCVVYNAASMNCSWEKGPAAPEVVFYYLSIRDDTNRYMSIACPQYVTKSGRNIGCHFPDMSGFRIRNHLVLTGLSYETQIQPFDAILTVKDIECIDPPSKITVECSNPCCRIRWEQPRTLSYMSYLELEYQLDIRKRRSLDAGSRNTLIKVAGSTDNVYNFMNPEPGAKYTVQIRAANLHVNRWGAWSQLVEFGLDKEPYWAIILQ